MRIFISWSGDRSQRVAEALADWMPKVLQGVRPWLSKRDIGSGTRWSLELSKALQEDHFGILCLTPENLNEPWIHFEAGALAKSIDQSRVVPYLWGGITPADLVPPLGEFQAMVSNRDDTRKLVSDINTARGSNGVEERHWSAAFNALFPNLQEALKAIPATGKPAVSKRTALDLAEESLGILRTLARQVSILTNHPVGPLHESSTAELGRLTNIRDELVLKTAFIIVAGETSKEGRPLQKSVSMNALQVAAVRALTAMGVKSPERHGIAVAAAELAFDDLRARMNEASARAMRGEEQGPPASD